jgi:predicted enzyme related to lactoylglutathione lyase
LQGLHAGLRLPLVKTVRALGGWTGDVYVVVADCDAHCARARAAGAEILYGPRDTDYRSRESVAGDGAG